MKKNRLSQLGAALLTLALLISPFTGSTAAADTTVDADGDGVIRVLGIGSSFGVDGITNLYAAYQAQTGKDNLVLGNLYHGGCTLAQHVKASQSGEAFYDYYTIDKNNADMQWSVSAGESGSYGSTLDEGLLAQNWDVIVVQQGAANAGVLDSYNDDMDTLFSYIRSKDNCKDAKLYWHMTWAFPPTYAVDRTGDPLVQNYQGSTAVMYEYILRCMQEKVYPYVQAGTLTDIIPSGIAIENARTSYLEHSLHRDIQHLNALGRTISGYCYYAMLFNGGNALDSIALEVAPADTRSDCKCAAVPMSQLDRQVVLESVNNALTANAARSYTPEASVTPSAYPQPCGGSHTTALTADNLETALAAGGQLYLTDDVSAAVSGPITLTADTTLCLNGHTLNFVGGVASGDKGVLCTAEGIRLDLCDCSDEESGAITGTGSKADSLIYVNKSVMTLHSGSIRGTTGFKYAPVRVFSGSTFIMNGGAISGNRATNVGGIYITDGVSCTFEMYGGEISGNTGGTFGGGIYGGANAKINLCGGSIHTNTATNGGGVYLKGATLRLVRGNISGNVSTANGGGVYMTTYTTSTKEIKSAVKIYHGTIGGTTVEAADKVGPATGNYATNGGGVYGAGTVDMYQASAGIVGNCAATFGGGVYMNSDGMMTMQNGAASYNNADQGGAAVYVAGGQFSLSGGTITGSAVTGTATPGAVHICEGGSLAMSGGSIVNNAAVCGLLIQTSEATGLGGTASITGGTITGNKKDIKLMGESAYATATGGTVGTWDVDDGSVDMDTNGDGTIRVLVIGNSFGVDGISQLYQILRAEGETRDIYLGDLYKGGCALAEHVSYIKSAGYYYYTNTDGSWQTQNDGELVKTEYALEDGGQWDIIVLHQSTPLSGQGYSYTDGNLDALIAHVKQKQPGAKLYWYMNWAYPDTSERTSSNGAFSRYYDDDQMTMYNAIASANQQHILPRVGVDFAGIIPTATVIQNARSGYVAERDLHRDTLHLSNFGRLFAGYSFYCTMTGKTLNTVAVNEAVADYRSPGIGGDKVAYTLREADKALIVQSVKDAMKTPFAVTQSGCVDYCGGTHNGWTALTSGNFATAMTQSGSYYLGSSFSITPGSTITVGADVTLCLNGCTLTQNAAQVLFTVNEGCKLTICDCGANGTITYAKTSAKQAIQLKGGQVIMKGGTISGFRGTTGGAVILSANGSTFLMDGGTFTQNTATNGGVFFSNYDVTIELHDGATITGNHATKFGGAINLNGGTLKIYKGAVISNNTAVGNATATNNRGGAIRLGASSTIGYSATCYMYGGEIYGNTADGTGSAVDMGQASLILRGGSIRDNLAGAATTGGGIFVDDNAASLALYGGAVTGNAHSGICVRRGRVVMSDGQVTGNGGLDLSLIAKTSGYSARVTVKDGTVGSLSVSGGEDKNSLALWGGLFGQDPAGVAGAVLASGTGVKKIGQDRWQVVYDYTTAHATAGEHAGWTDLQELIDAGTYELEGGLYCLNGDVQATKNFTVSGKVVICLHGHTITDAGSGKDQFFDVDVNGELYLEDCAVLQGSITGKATQRGLYVKEGGAAWLRGGTIQGFKASSGAGVRVDNGGAFYMEGGRITGNNGTGNGGAIYCYGDLTLSGGEITGNTAKTAGGAVIFSQGTFRMTGGTVSDNTSAEGKGDIHIIGGHFYGEGGYVDDVFHTGSSNYVDISGGQYSTELKTAWLAKGCKFVTGNKLAHRVVRDLQTTGAVVENESSLSLRISLNQLVAPDFDRYRAVITKAFHYGDEAKDQAAQTAGKVEGTLAQLAVNGEYGAACLTYANVSAKEMGDAVTVSVYTEDGLLLHTETYSVADQIKAVLATEGIGTELKNLCVDALNYGAAAQTRFDYNTADPVNAGLTQTSTTVVPEWTDGLSVSAGHEALYAATASLKEKLELNLYFDVDCSQSVPAVTVTADGKAVGHTVSTVSNGTKTILRVTVDGLDVKDAKALITCTVGDITVTDSIASYLVRNTSQRDRAVIGALMRYVESAIALARLAG